MQILHACKTGRFNRVRIKRRSIFINGLIVAGTGFVLLYLHRHITPVRQPVLIDQILDSLGLTIIFFGEYIRISARGYKSLRISEKQSLITSGPYEMVRNPMYLGSFLIGLGIVVMTLKIWMTPIYILLYLLWYQHQLSKEEQHLIKRFGQDYLDYTQATPRFFPHVKGLLEFDIRKYIPLRPEWIKKEWNTILVWVLVVVFLEGYEDLRQYGFSALLKEFSLLFFLTLYFIAFAFIFREK
ncbi:MAG: hypothetical protein DRP62_02940 [Planctomycetota bacterium]|nr:MAG: hypothetical protein DRP62_02940 [Planctomycetota bacterium]